MNDIFESKIDLTQQWYFGNNRTKNLKLSKPQWYAPFFLTTSYEYAEKYSDYGVYTIILKNEAKSKILDFNKDSDVKKLHWPKELIDDIRTGKSDLNGIAYDMYVLAGYGHSPEVFDKSWRLSDAAYDFDVRSKHILRIVPKHATWASEKDHRFLLQMWKDIYDAGFDGFTHMEFGNKILAIFNFHCIDKISIKPIDMPLNESMQNDRLIKIINEVLFAYKQKFGFDLSYMKFKVDSQPVYTNGEPCYEYDENECAGDWTSLGWIRLNPDMKSVIDRYGITWHGSDDIEEFTKIIIAHELAYEVWNKIADDDFKNDILNNARNSSFNTKYLDTVKPNKLNEETFCEYLAHEVVQQDNAQYEPPYTLQQIKAKYPKHIYKKLANDPVHRWRAETGIELIHKEPTKEELNRIWKNWQLMPQKMKDISDKKSIELFGCTNTKHYNELKASEDHLNENKATYLQKYRDELDVKSIVDMFWAIRNRLSAPQNDIDWWIKKPFNDLKSFVQNFDISNKRQRRDANYKQQAIDSGAKLLDTRDGYEMWYVPTYDAMVAIGRFYKGRSAKWCVASDDPDFWFDNHEDSEFVVLVREHPKNDEFDKVAIEMMNHGRYYNEDDVIPWDLENEDWTFTNDDLMHEAWLLFKDNGETREQYFG